MYMCVCVYVHVLLFCMLNYIVILCTHPLIYGRAATSDRPLSEQVGFPTNILND